jgi:murein DD-endopeptidase MepM/ murein hydrolase activator NlpD
LDIEVEHRDPTDETSQVTSFLGCADWPTWKFMQTPIASDANGNGWSNAGPSWYGEGRHLDCSRTDKINDHHAIDYTLDTGNYVYAPSTGTVIWAGTAGCGWSDFGNIVIVDHGNGYWSLSAHLNSIWVSYGNSVAANTVIGTAGQSGAGASYTHLHQGVYLNAGLDNDCGGIFAGQSVEPHDVQYFRNGGGTYADINQYQAISY